MELIIIQVRLIECVMGTMDAGNTAVAKKLNDILEKYQALHQADAKQRKAGGPLKKEMMAVYDQ